VTKFGSATKGQILYEKENYHTCVTAKPK